MLPFVSNAQLPSNLIGSLSINLQPEFPKPKEEVVATLDDYSLGIVGAEIVWTLDGEMVPDSTNKRSIRFTAGTLGESQRLSVTLRPPQGQPLQSGRTITPAAVDIIAEPQTYAPDFYKGRTLPSSHSTMQLTAMAHTKETGPFSYTWRVNNQTAGGGSVIGTNQIEVEIPIGREMVVSVDVRDSRGDMVARRAIAIPIVDPELYFYEVNALKGLIQLPILGTHTFIGPETTLQAAPYNLGNNLFDQDHLVEWSINNVTQTTDFDTPLQITLLRNQLGQGSASVGLRIRNLDNLMQGVDGRLQVQY